MKFLRELFEKKPLIRWDPTQVKEVIGLCFEIDQSSEYEHDIDPPADDIGLLKWYVDEEVDGSLQWAYVFLQVRFQGLPLHINDDLESVRKMVAYRLKAGK